MSVDKSLSINIIDMLVTSVQKLEINGIKVDCVRV